MSTRLLRLSAVLERTGYSRSAIYARASAGLFPRPVPLGLRTAAWPEHEVEAVLKAHLREANDEELKRLVAELRKQRHESRPATGETTDHGYAQRVTNAAHFSSAELDRPCAHANASPGGDDPKKPS